jgi:predicted nicotinamide N-methyase
MPRLQRLPESNVEYVYGIFLLTEKHKLIRALKKVHQPSVHGTRTWGSAFLTMDYLTHNPIVKGCSVLDLGCGWGASSVFCAHKFKAKVTAVDLDSAVFPFLNVFAEINSVEVKTRKADFAKLKGPDLGKHQVILGSDICFWDSLVDPLVNMVNRAIKNGVERIIIADPGRPTFYEFCDKVSAKHKVSLQEWYSVEPDRAIGEIIEIRPLKKVQKSK